MSCKGKDYWERSRQDNVVGPETLLTAVLGALFGRVRFFNPNSGVGVWWARSAVEEICSWVPGSLVVIKDIDFVDLGRSKAETP